MQLFSVLLVLSAIIGVSMSTADRIGCRDELGELVDWYYLYKLPNHYSNTVSSGLEYLYITPNSSSSWTKSSMLINSPESMPGQTLSLVYDSSRSGDLLVAMYNDEPTNAKVDSTRGHTKGVVVANDISGFWLVHSVPKFPPAMDEGPYDYPHTGTIYGQSFLCISFTGEQMGAVGKQLQYNEPTFYSSHVPSYLEHIYPQIVEALAMNEMTNPPFYNLATLRSRHGVAFTSFAKSRAFNKDLYEDFVAPHYKAGDFYVESWQHGKNLESDCSKPTKVYNVKDVSISVGESIEFSTMHDHSKWLVSDENELICVGDINRQEHQRVRGGGTVCAQMAAISKTYKASVEDSEPCEKVKKSFWILIKRFIRI